MHGAAIAQLIKGPTVEKQQEKPTDAMFTAPQVDHSVLFPATGGVQGKPLNFVARSIIVDNFNTQYVYLPDTGRWALPGVAQQVFPINEVGTKNATFQAPTGMVQPADNGSPCVITWTEQRLPLALGGSQNTRITALTNYEQAIPATANNGLLSVGPGPWDGARAGHFVGSALGTALAINTQAGFGGNYLQIQNGGSLLVTIGQNGDLVSNNGTLQGTGLVSAGRFCVGSGAHTAAHTLSAFSECISEDNATTGAYNVALPAASGCLTGQIFTIKKVDSSANAVTIVPSGTDTIEGAASVALSAQWAFRTLACNNARNGWIILGHN